MGTNIFSFIVVLGVLIFVHEFGHFLLAKLMRVGVETFSLGFGPRLLGRKLGMTEYRISAIPLGGYVKMVGEAPDSQVDPGMEAISFSHKSVWKRILIVFAGPAFNFVLAIIIFFCFFQFSGLRMLNAEVGELQAGMPAQEAGLRRGDRVVSVNGEKVGQWEDMTRLIMDKGSRPLVLGILREGRTLTVQVKPKIVASKNIYGEDIQKYAVGISPADSFTIKRLSMPESISEAAWQTWDISRMVVVSVGKIISGSLSPKTLGGPIMIAQLAGDQARAGVSNLIFLIALLSVNLGILNLLPIPVLDGGHLFFFVIEAISRRPVKVRMREVAQQIGVVILVLLMIFIFYNDIVRLFN